MRKTKEPSSLAVLVRIPVFRRLWIAISISSFGDWLGLLATTTLAAYLTKNSSGVVQGAAVSGVLLTRLLPDLVLGPFAGALVDRIDRRKIAVIGDSLAGLLYLSIAIGSNLTWLLIAQFLVEAVGLFTNPAKQAMWVNIVPRERLAVANQLNYVSIYGMVPVAAAVFALLSTVAQFFGAATVADSGSATGKIISGPTSAVAVNIALCLDAATYFFCALTVFLSRRMIPSFTGERSEGKSLFRLIAEGVSFVKNSAIMRSIYVGILGAFGAGGLTAGVAQLYVSSLGAGSAGYGILFGTVFTGLAFGMLLGPKIFPTVPRRVVFTSSIGCAGLVLIVMSVLQDFVGAVLAAAVMGLFAGIAWINGFTMIGQEVSDRLRGRVFAFVMSSVRLTLLATVAVGPVVAGAIGPWRVRIGDFSWNFPGAAVVLGVGGIIALLVSLYAGKQVNGRARGPLSALLRRRGADILTDRTNYRGALLVVEGADVAAVSGWTEAVVAHLSGSWTVIRTDPVAPLADEDQESMTAALQAAADLSATMSQLVRPALLQGHVVVSHAFADSLIVRYGVLGGLSEERIWRLAEWALEGSWPDLTLLVEDGTDADPETVAAFSGLASATPERYLRVSAPAPGSAVALTAEVIERLDSVLRQRSPLALDGPLGETVSGGVDGLIGSLEPASPASPASPSDVPPGAPSLTKGPARLSASTPTVTG